MTKSIFRSEEQKVLLRLVNVYTADKNTLSSAKVASLYFIRRIYIDIDLNYLLSLKSSVHSELLIQ